MKNLIFIYLDLEVLPFCLDSVFTSFATTSVSFTSFADLRFTKSDGSTLLDYWIEFITGTSPNLIAKVWIELAPSPDTIPASPGTYTFYIYYSIHEYLIIHCI